MKPFTFFVIAALSGIVGWAIAFFFFRVKLAAQTQHAESQSLKAQTQLKNELDEKLDSAREDTITKTRQRVQIQLREELSDEVRQSLREQYNSEIKEEAQTRAHEDAQRILNEANKEREALLKQSELDAKAAKLDAQRDAESQLKSAREKLDRVEERLSKRESTLDARNDKTDAREARLKSTEETLEQTQRALQLEQTELDAKELEIQTKLADVAKLSPEDARTQIIERIVGEAKIEASKQVRALEEEAMEDAERRAKKIISISIQRYAGEFAAERCVSVVQLPTDEMKGRIIGREGRNIRALEAATGVDIIIDDTPEAVIVSGFDPVRREIARRCLEKLISDGRIHPSRIEEVALKTEQEVAKTVKDAGEQAAFELGIHGLHPELIKVLGRLRYRTSYGQNMWSHSIEVGFLCGLMAAELGMNVKMARRAGLLHDIGKALTHEQEGSHAVIGGELARKYGEHEVVRNAIAAHHNDEPQNSIIAHLVIAADALSGARPGARREILETYIKRLEDLERISMEFEGVEKTYAIQAGREIRVLVQNSQVNDDQAFALSKEIARKIEDELTYPGQIKVTVIRETRAVEFAR